MQNKSEFIFISEREYLRAVGSKLRLNEEKTKIPGASQRRGYSLDQGPVF